MHFIIYVYFVLCIYLLEFGVNNNAGVVNSFSLKYLGFYYNVYNRHTRKYFNQICELNEFMYFPLYFVKRILV